MAESRERFQAGVGVGQGAAGHSLTGGWTVFTSSMDIEVVSYRHVFENGRSYYVYTVRATVAGRSYTVEKRYSDMLSLHKKLKKQMNAPSFPPKQIRNHDPKVLDARKVALSNYFGKIAHGNLITKTLLDFLDVHHFPTSLEFTRLDSQDYEDEVNISDDNIDLDEPSHAPVLVYTGDKFFRTSAKRDDIIVPGVLKGLYG